MTTLRPEVYAIRNGRRVDVADLFDEHQWRLVCARLDNDEKTVSMTAEGFAGKVLRHLAKITGWRTIIHKGSGAGTPYPWAKMCLDAIEEATERDADRAIVLLNLIQGSARWEYRPMTDPNKMPLFLRAMIADTDQHVGYAQNKLVPTGGEQNGYVPSGSLKRLLEVAHATDRRPAAEEPASDGGPIADTPAADVQLREVQGRGVADA